MTQWGLDTLFNPAKRHMDEEKQRLQSTREEVGDASGGKRIDLESGKVVIARAANEDESDEDAGVDAAVTTVESAPEDATAPAKPETAADRARRRHQRTPKTAR